MSFITESKKLLAAIALPICLTSSPGFAQGLGNFAFDGPLYAGFMGGVGTTTWDGLVPAQVNQNAALMMSTPINSEEGGGVWGAFVGYEFTPFFAVEGAYINYPRATIWFDGMSLFSFNNDGLTYFHTHAEVLSLMAKIMLKIPATNTRVFSSIGPATVHRYDMLLDGWTFSPSFGVGVNNRMTKHFMWEINGNYTAGYGDSRLNPAESYYPFLVSVTLRLAYCF